MDSRERVRLALTCRKPDRIPRALGFFPQSLPQIAPISPEDYFGLDIRYVEFDPPPEQEGFLAYLEGLPRDLHLGSLAQLQTYYEWGYHPERGEAHPLGQAASPEETLRFALPDLADPRRHAHLRDQVARWHEGGLAVAAAPPHLGGELLETAWRLRGFEAFLTDLLVRKPLAHYLLDQLTDLVVESTLILVQAGVDILLLDDDVAMPTGLLISPGLWREFFKLRLARIIHLAREVNPDLLVFYHSDGNFTRLVPDLVEIGMNAINPLQPDCMDAVAIKREFGGRLALWGTVGTAALWDRGTPDQVREEVRLRVETLGPEGLLLAPAYDLDFAPWENIVAFVAAAEEFGRAACAS
jgi:uroporphyrinogen decarboxylase